MVFAAGIAVCWPTPAAARTEVAGRVVDGPLPGATQGAIVVRAVEPSSSRIIAAARARRDGTYRLDVRPGVLMLVADVVRAKRVRVTAITVATRVRAGRRRSLRISLRRRKPVLPRRGRAAIAMAGAADVASPVIAVKEFVGSGPYPQLGPGLSSMLETDLVDQAGERCGARVIAWRDRGLLQREFDLQRRYRRFFDPATLVHKRWLRPTVFVQGRVSTDAGGAMAWDLQLVQAGSGEVIGGHSGSTPASGVFSASKTIATRLLNQICVRHINPCALYSATQAQALLREVVAGRRPVEDVRGGYVSRPVSEARRGSPLDECAYISSFGDAIWIDHLLDTPQLAQRLRTLQRVQGVGDAAFLDTSRPTHARLYFFVGPLLMSVQILITETSPVDALVGLGRTVAGAARSG